MGLMDNVQQAENFEQKCLCVFAIDVSGSMSSCVHELNTGLQKFAVDVASDPALCAKLEVGIVTFGSTADVLQTPALLDAFEMPILKVDGFTAMVGGVRLAMQMVQDRKDYWKQSGMNYYRPWIVLITDGEPDDDQDVKGLAREVEDAKQAKKFQFLPIGVKGANMQKLALISGSKPHMLQGFNFAKFFTWLSDSMGRIAKSKEGDKIKLPEKDWTEEEFIV
jgi:uncharacterized protein YegL